MAIFILQAKALIMAVIATNQIARTIIANALKRESLVEMVAIAEIARFYYFFCVIYLLSSVLISTLEKCTRVLLDLIDSLLRFQFKAYQSRF